MPAEHILALTVNDEPIRRLVPAHRSLLDFLRDDLDLTGSKHGCDVGDCGACTVLVDGVPRLACITLAVEVDGRAIRTIEGVAQGDRLHPVQVAFDRHVASQCGYCTPGIVMALIALLEEDPHPDDDTLKHVLGSNICRCTGYTKILAAAREAAGRPPGAGGAG
jgi:aerobic-type carbon monoxide dehydrogenase small subunit (CoxS/CutS family)